MATIRQVTVVYVTGEIRMAGVRSETDGEAVAKLLGRKSFREDETEILTVLMGDHMARRA